MHLAETNWMASKSHFSQNCRLSPFAIESSMCPQQPRFKSGDYAIWGPCSRESTKAGSLTPLISWNRRSCWSNAHYHGASLIIVSVNGNVVCSVPWIKMTVTLNTRFTNCLYYKNIVVTDVVLKYFLEYSTTFFADYQPGSDMLIYTAPSSVLRFH